MQDALEKVIRPIVEGQIRSFLHDHPEVADGWTGKRSDGRTKATAVMNSLAKRIARDLLCPDTRVRMMAALVALRSAAPSAGCVAAHHCATGAGGGTASAPGVPDGGRP